MTTGSFKVNSATEMHRLAGAVAREIADGTVLCLEGELGAGKTTFVQGLAKALGIREKVTSPSFTVVSEYQVNTERGLKLVHVDLYRLPEKGAENEVAVRDVLEKAGQESRVTVVEWADRLDGGAIAEVVASDKIWRIKFAHGKNLEERIVEIELSHRK